MHTTAWIRYLWVTVVLAMPLLAQAKLEFAGFLSLGDSSQFILRDTVSDKTAWVKLGDEFAGYTVASFDRPNDTLKLKKGSEELLVKLKDSVTQSGPATLPPELVERGLTPHDLLVRMDEQVKIFLGPGIQQTPRHKRFVSVHVQTPQGNYGVDWDNETSAPVTAARLPAAAGAFLRDADFVAINRHLEIVGRCA